MLIISQYIHLNKTNSRLGFGRSRPTVTIVEGTVWWNKNLYEIQWRSYNFQSVGFQFFHPNFSVGFQCIPLSTFQKSLGSPEPMEHKPTNYASEIKETFIGELVTIVLITLYHREYFVTLLILYSEELAVRRKQIKQQQLLLDRTALCCSLTD